MAERRAINKRIRENTFAYLDKKNIKYIPSETNFFMMEVNRPGTEFAQDMAKQKVVIGARMVGMWPTKVRVTVGTQAEMDKFTAAVSAQSSAKWGRRFRLRATLENPHESSTGPLRVAHALFALAAS